MKPSSNVCSSKSITGTMLYFMCGMAVTGLCAMTMSIILPGESRISVYASPEPVVASSPMPFTVAEDAEMTWTVTEGIEASRDSGRYVEGNGSTCFIIPATFGGGAIASGRAPFEYSGETGTISLWLRAEFLPASNADIKLVSDDGDTLTISENLLDGTWHRVSFSSGTGQESSITLALDGAYVDGFIWLDGIRMRISPDADISYQELVYQLREEAIHAV